MRVGERAAFVVGPNYGYGSSGVAPVIPPSATLTFEVEVIDLKGNILTDATFADAAPLTPRTPSAIKVGCTYFSTSHDALVASLSCIAIESLW